MRSCLNARKRPVAKTSAPPNMFWDNKNTHVISEGADTRRTSVSQAMFDRTTDERYVLLKKGEEGAESYVGLSLP